MLDGPVLAQVTPAEEASRSAHPAVVELITQVSVGLQGGFETDEALLSVKAGLRDRGFAYMDRGDRHILDTVILYRFWYTVEGSEFSFPLDLQVGSSVHHQSVQSRAV